MKERSDFETRIHRSIREENFEKNFSDIRTVTLHLRELYKKSALEAEKITAADVDMNSRLQSIKIIELVRSKIIEEIEKNTVAVTADQLRSILFGEIHKIEIDNRVIGQNEGGLLRHHREKISFIVLAYVRKKESFSAFMESLNRSAEQNNRTSEVQFLSECGLRAEQAAVEFSGVYAILRFKDKNDMQRFRVDTTSPASFFTYRRIGTSPHFVPIIAIDAGDDRTSYDIEEDIGHEKRHFDWSVLSFSLEDLESKRVTRMLYDIRDSVEQDAPTQHLKL